MTERAEHGRSRIGETLGPYRLVERIFAGEVVDTYVAQMQAGHGFERLVALRCPKPNADANSRAYGILYSEASVGALVQHPNVLSARGVHLSEDGVPYVTTPYFESVSVQRLWQVLRQKKERMPLALGLTVGRELCSALRHIHGVRAAGNGTSVLLHHGLTPDAVQLTFEGDVLVSGLEGVTWSESTTRQPHPRTAFVAPERSRGDYGVRGDLFAIAGILYFLVNGKEPKSASSGPYTMHPTLPAGAPEAFQALMYRAMHVDPARRFSSALKFQIELEDFAALYQLGLSKVQLGRYINAHVERPAPVDALERFVNRETLELAAVDTQSADARRDGDEP